MFQSSLRRPMKSVIEIVVSSVGLKFPLISLDQFSSRFTTVGKLLANVRDGNNLADMRHNLVSQNSNLEINGQMALDRLREIRVNLYRANTKYLAK